MNEVIIIENVEYVLNEKSIMKRNRAILKTEN